MVVLNNTCYCYNPFPDAPTFDAMTDAIEEAAVVVPVLTTKYQDSANARKGKNTF